MPLHLLGNPNISSKLGLRNLFFIFQVQNNHKVHNNKNNVNEDPYTFCMPDNKVDLCQFLIFGLSKIVLFFFIKRFFLFFFLFFIF